MIWKLTCGVEVLIDEDDYNKIDKTGWYLLDERSTTIENELINNTNSDIEQLLGINLKELIVSKVGSSESKWT